MGEGVCDLCEEPNPTWFTADGAWNRVVGGDHRREAGGIWCPRCFMVEGGGLWEVRRPRPPGRLLKLRNRVRHAIKSRR